MSVEYDNYLIEHRNNVARGAMWLKLNLPEVMYLLNPYEYADITMHHDDSKDDFEEYEAYDTYFYGAHRTQDVKDKFNQAWLHHIHNNPHHWQHWVLVNDDPEESTIALDIPYCYVIEMICDWWAFSWSKDNLYEIFDWYDKHKDYMILSDHTRELVEEILDKIRHKLDEITPNATYANHGIN